MLSVVSALVRAWPFANGQGRIIDKVIRLVRFPSGRVSVPAAGGFRVDVLGEDHIGRHLILSGQFDPNVVDQLLRFSHPGDVILDIGANIGYVTCKLLAAIPNSTAICVEPNPAIVGLLRDNVGQFEGRATVIEGALSRENGTAVLNLDLDNSGASSIERDRPAHKGVSIKTIATAEFLSSLERVDLIKIDVEGHEVPIIQAGIAEIARLQPKAILFEHQGAEAGPGGDIGRLFANIDYEVYGIAKRLLDTRLEKIVGGSSLHYNDYLAVSTKRPETLH